MSDTAVTSGWVGREHEDRVVEDRAGAGRPGTSTRGAETGGTRDTRGTGGGAGFAGFAGFVGRPGQAISSSAELRISSIDWSAGSASSKSDSKLSRYSEIRGSSPVIRELLPGLPSR